MPSEACARREVFLCIGQCLTIVAEACIDREVRPHAEAVLNESGREPLRQFIAADPEVDGLCVLLNVGKCQLAEWRRRCVVERERTEDRRAGLAAGSAGSVTNNASTEAEIVPAQRPGQRVGELRLMTKNVGGSRLSDRERHRTRARI